MKAARRRGLPLFAGLVVIVTMLGVRSLFPDTFERLRLFGFDTLQRMDPWQPALSAVTVIDIDDASLKRLGQWPWSRSTIADLVRNLQDDGVKAIAFDVVFAEADRTSPASLAKSWEKAFGWHPPAGAPASLPDYDSDLSAAFGRGRVVTGFGLLAGANGASPLEKSSIATIGGDPVATISNFGGAVVNLPALENAAAGNGSFTITANHDQVIRSLPLLFAVDGKLVPSLSLETLRVAEDEDTIRVRAEHTGSPNGPVEGYTVRIGDHDVPLGVDGSLALHHGAARSSTMISAWRVLDSAQHAELRRELDGRIALIGTSAVGLSDLRATPLNPLEPGVNMHARALEQILGKHFLTRPSWAAGAEFVAAAGVSLLAVVLVTFCGLRVAMLSGVVAIAVIIASAWLAFSRSQFLFDPSLIVVATCAAGIASSFARYLVADRDASRLRSAFTHYLSPDLVEALARNPDQLKLGGELREMTFLFTDLEGFTSLIEASDPELIVDLLNHYLDGMCRIAMEHGGTVDKIVGDALHVMFNAPLDQPDHAARAVRCAIAMDAFAQRYSCEKKAVGISFGSTRIGVNTGSAVVGNFGGSRRFDYTAHGDAINTAARLESANKTLGTRICIARSTVNQVGGVAFLPVGTLMLKGKSQGVDVFVPDLEPADASGLTNAYLQAFALMVAGDASGSAALVALYERHPEHPILRLHARRINHGETSTRMVA